MLCCYLNGFVYINECIVVNTALKTFLQIYELFGWVGYISFHEIPMLASPRLYLVTFFQIYEDSLFWESTNDEKNVL